MNDFTKEELIILRNGIDYLQSNQQLNLSNQYVNKCKNIEEKLKSMVDNYDMNAYVELLRKKYDE